MRATLLALSLATAMAAPAASWSWQATVDVFEGTLQGFFDSDTFPHLKACASEAADAYDEIKKGIDEVEQLTPASVKAGLADLGQALDGLKAALVDCKASSADVEKFVKAVEDGFKHPLSFLFHAGKELLVNGQQIYKEVTTAVADFKSQSYRDAGVQIGEALSKLLTPDFATWKLAHSKFYATAEAEEAARAAFELNADLARSTHLATSLGAHLHLNEYADLPPAEFNKRNGFVPSQHMHKATATHRMSGKALPASIDWRQQGLVNEVKNQGGCGSCWAFSTVVSIEGQHAKNTKSLVSLSEQNLVDCVHGVKLPNDTSTCCMGCQGGLMDDAFSYVITKQAGAIDTEAAYPYSGRAGTCAFDGDKKGAKIGGWTDVPAGNETALMDAVANVGPISVAVDASIGWQLYFGGILKPTLCSSNPKKMDHGVAVVGYGTEKGTDYWIVRNSWGKGWGEKGYVRLLRGKNACGVANAASYPTGVSL